MRAIVQLFAKSPFGALQEHMSKSAECVELVRPMFEALLDGEEEKLAAIAKDISKLEHRADEIKNEIRDSLPRSIFLPVDRADLLSVLSQQDSIPDTVEDIAFLLTVRRTYIPPSWREPMLHYVERCVETFHATNEVFGSLESLLAAGLGVLCKNQSIGLPVVALDTFDFLTQGYSTLGMMLVGLGLTSLNLRRLDISWIAYTFTAKFLVWPALAILAVMLDRALFGLFDPLAHQVLVIQSLVPMAAMTAVHASVQQVHPDKASLAVALSTVLALAWLPFGLWIAGLLL